jgi:16S rRNA (guanine966-N2)-methyltransferase
LVKITGGKFRGRNINSAITDELRPTTSFFREWIFNVLNNMIDLSNARILDLFAGTGIISFEFLSRGAHSSVAVEKDARLISLIRSNNILDSASLQLIQSDCPVFLKNIIAKNAVSEFNIIFMDAPYEKDFLTDEVLELLFSNGEKLSEDVLIIVETDKDKVLKMDDNFVILKSKNSGTTKISVIGRKA